MTNFAFFGTDEFAVAVLDTLKPSGLVPSLIISTPSESPVKFWAQKNNITLLQPLKLDSAFTNHLVPNAYSLFLVASYGKLIPENLINLPKHGTLNIHPSLLPAYRGPSPIQTAIIDGITETGVTLMLLDNAMDHGPIIASSVYRLVPKSYVLIRDELAKLGAELLIKILPDYLDGKIKPVAQNHALATYTKKIEKLDGEIKLDDDAKLNYRKFLAYVPSPGIYTIVSGKRVKITVASLEDNKFIIKKVIPEGKREMGWADFLRGLRE